MTPNALPRSEYPRPRLRREKWLCLNGTWEFAFDEADRGLQDGWPHAEALEAQITVPFAHQWALSGLEDRRVCETVWYARNFEVPTEWQGQRVLLHFGAVDYVAEIWINGAAVGEHQGGHVPFSFDVTALLKPGQNRVVVRVTDSQDKHQPRGKQASSGLPRGIDYWCTTGIWQTVWLEPVANSYLADLAIESFPERDGIEVRPVVYGSRANVEVEVEVLDGDRVVATCRQCALASESFALAIEGAKSWSPASPFLYGVRARLIKEGAVLDEVESYAGVRTVEVKDGRFTINGGPTILRLVLDQGYWPDGGMTAPTDEALKADIEASIALGFNGARKHQKVEDPRWLYWCDQLGFLAWGEMANARAWSPAAQRELEAEWTSAIERDRSHPCVIAWVPLNESMGFPNLESGDVRQRNGVERLAHLTRRLDPTRPVIDNDGWEQTDVSDVVAIHDYSHTGAELAARYEQAVLPERIWSGSRISLLPGVVPAGRPILLTEVGGFLTRPEDTQELDPMYRIYDSISDLKELERKVVELMEGIGSVPFLGGFCYTQLTDVEQEMNGLLTYDRRYKVDPAVVKASLERLAERLAGVAA